MNIDNQISNIMQQ